MFLRAVEPPIDEVNFWKPGSGTTFAALMPGEPLFFKLKAPYNAIAGFGYFAHFSRLPVSMVWDMYGEANGARSYGEMRQRLVRLRTRFDRTTDPKQDFWIGCILVNQPAFFEDRDWIRTPQDFKGQTVQGKVYDLTRGEGERIWMECLARAARVTPRFIGQGRTDRIADAPLIGGYGAPVPVRPRLGQRSFRVAVLDSYGRRCAVTNEKTLPVLEAAHIRDFRDVQVHSVSNGILLRADIQIVRLRLCHRDAGIPVRGQPQDQRGIRERPRLLRTPWFADSATAKRRRPACRCVTPVAQRTAVSRLKVSGVALQSAPDDDLLRNRRLARGHR